MKRRTSMLHLRVGDEFRAKIQDYAQRKNLTVTDLLVRYIEAGMAREDEPVSPFGQAAHFPHRVIETERQYGLTILESAKSLADFGVKTPYDLTTPEVLMKGMTEENVHAFVRRYEINLQWLLTGEGRIYGRSHHGWYRYEIAHRIADRFLANDLTRVWFISSQSEPQKRDTTRIIIALEKPHPILGKPFQVFESFPVTGWHDNQKNILDLVRFCVELYKATGEDALYPRGRTLYAQAFEKLEAGWSSFAQAFNDTTYAWSPEQEYRDHYEGFLAKDVDRADIYDWDSLEKVKNETLAKLEFKREAERGALLAKTRPSEEV
jgi:hypothetical protein